MEVRSKCVGRIERLVTMFLKELSSDRLLALQIPNLTAESDMEEIMQAEDILWELGDKQISRRVDSPLSSRNYAQLMAVIALVAELQARK